MASIGPFVFPDSGYEAAIFDCDGTLVHSMPAHFEAWQAALAGHGAPGVFTEEVFYTMGGKPTWDIVSALNERYGLSLDPHEVSATKRREYLNRLDSVELIREVADFARSLVGRMPLIVATGSNHQVVGATLRRLGVADWFAGVVTSEDVERGKPAPDIFLRAAELAGVAPEKCLALEDAPPGVLAAERAGMRVVTIPKPIA